MDDLMVEHSHIFKYNYVSGTTHFDCLCKPVARNAAAMHAVLQPSTGFQITHAMSHFIVAQGLLDLYGALRNKEDANATFCVPPSQFAKYRKQAVSGALDMSQYPFEQFVLEIPIWLWHDAG